VSAPIAASAVQLPLDLGAPPLRLCVLGSGSSGNAVVLESGRERLLVDAGFSCREIERRLTRVGAGTEGFVGLVVTHEHHDHVRGALRFARRRQVPIWATRGTIEAAGLEGEEDVELRVLSSSRPTTIGSFAVTPFAVPHDAQETIGVVVENPGGHRMGLVGDLGSRTQLAWGHLAELDILLLETNHDLEMLRTGPYPWPLKERVASRHGHLSNRQAADALPELLCDRLRTLVLYHLSRINNRPSLAVAELGEVLARHGAAADLVLSNQFEPTRWIAVG
jgi:phosphoribosyl 1,2-cyclic phosphodiesterase